MVARWVLDGGSAKSRTTFFVFLIEKLSATPKDRADETKCQAPPMLYCTVSLAHQLVVNQNLTPHWHGDLPWMNWVPFHD